MLLRFGVSNYLSIKDRQELSLVASKLKDDESGLITPPATVKERVLPAAVIYGANASGKSNVVKAFEFMRHFALYSHSRGEPGKPIGVTPFALDPECADKPSEFDIDFVAGGQRFAYSFSVTGEAVQTEELVAYPHARPQLWFSRKAQEFSFGKSLTGRNRVIADLVRDNSLFLSAAAQNDHEMLKGVVGFFCSLSLGDIFFASLRKALSNFRQELVDERVINFLGRIGTGIVGQRLVPYSSQETGLMISQMLHAAQQTASFESSRIDASIKPAMILELAHEDKAGNEVFFATQNESTGTQRLLIFMEDVYRSLDAGTPIVIDELDASLHSKACEAVVALFTSTKTNPHGAQLIATTHDTNLMRSPLLRRDQIWLTEKSSEGETELFSLSDFPTRATDNLERAYMQGRFGATPFTGSARNLVEAG